ncbi:ABC transporter permease [Cytophagaceae bacterium ABcell3]|nr:ABC transporter permease [Cytophagaceae bacterium ABcell3]
MNSPLVQLIIFQFKNFYRTPGIVFWAILFPILMAWVLGLAFTTTGVQHKTVYRVSNVEGPFSEKTGIPPQQKGELSLGEDLDAVVLLTVMPASEEEAIRALRRGVIPLYFTETEDSLFYHFDKQNAEAQNTYLLIERELSPKLRESAQTIEPVTATGSRYIDFLIPGLIALGIMNSCMWGISWNLIEYRMKKLLRRMVATPMRKTDFLISMFISRFVLALIEAIILYVFASIFFNVEISGSLLAFLLVFTGGIAAFAGIAVIASARSASSQVGNGIINAVVLPMTILSGVFFSYHNFPEWAVSVIQFLPLTLLADSLRSVFIEHAGIGDVLLPFIILSTTGGVTFAIGLKLFKWH